MRTIAILTIVSTLAGCYASAPANKQTAYAVDGLGLGLGSLLIVGGISAGKSEDEVTTGTGTLLAVGGVVIACAAAIGLLMNATEPDPTSSPLHSP